MGSLKAEIDRRKNKKINHTGAFARIQEEDTTHQEALPNFQREEKEKDENDLTSDEEAEDDKDLQGENYYEDGNSSRFLKGEREARSPYRIMKNRSMKLGNPSLLISQKKKGNENPNAKSIIKTSLISMVGRIMIVIRQAKRRLNFYKMRDTSTKNLLLINDVSHFFEDKAFRRESSIYLKRKLSRVEIIREYIISAAITG